MGRARWGPLLLALYRSRRCPDGPERRHHHCTRCAARLFIRRCGPTDPCNGRDGAFVFCSLCSNTHRHSRFVSTHSRSLSRLFAHFLMEYTLVSSHLLRFLLLPPFLSCFLSYLPSLAHRWKGSASSAQACRAGTFSCATAMERKERVATAKIAPHREARTVPMRPTPRRSRHHKG